MKKTILDILNRKLYTECLCYSLFLQHVEVLLVEVFENKYKRLKLISLFLAEEILFYVFKQLDTTFAESSLKTIW